LDYLRDLGVRKVRMSFLLPVSPEMDLFTHALASLGIEIVAVLPLDPVSDIAQTHQISEMVKRFRDRVNYWELGSGPDNPAIGWPADNLKSYAASFIRLAQAIKSLDPRARVLNGGLNRSLPQGITRLYEHGAGAYVDIWSVHPFMSPLMPDALGGLRYFSDRIKKTLELIGQRNKTVWWTSIACPGMGSPGAAKDWWLGKNPTEKVQAEWLKILYTNAREMGAGTVFWQGLTDRPGKTGTGRDYFGLCRADGAAKPSYAIYRELSQNSQFPRR
jgi:hypothetical protein